MQGIKLTELWDRLRTPKPWAYGRERIGSNPDLIVGVELETENAQVVSNNMSLQQWMGENMLRIENDGSLRGNHAYEFISAPMKMRHITPLLEDFFSKTQFNAENYSDRCSVHVHVNCTDMRTDEIAAIALLYTVFEDILFEFVGGEREENIYCIPWNQCRNHLDLVYNLLNDPVSALRKWVKYTALNVQPLSTYGTIEFRHMHGTADIRKLERWMDIIGQLVLVARTEGLESLTEIIKTLNSSSEYEMLFRRVMHGVEYDERYASKMEDGVIFAKYSLVNLRTNKKATPYEAAPYNFDAVLGGLLQPRVRIRRNREEFANDLEFAVYLQEQDRVEAARRELMAGAPEPEFAEGDMDDEDYDEVDRGEREEY